MDEVDGQDYYECTIPTDHTYTKVIFCRMNGNNSENIWGNKWNQTDNLTIPTDNKVLFTVPANAWDGSTDTNNWSNAGIFVDKENDFADKTNRYAHDQGFGMKLEIPFTLKANGLNEDGTHQIFSFSGDDDLWVFVDGKLILDLGGAHARTSGFIDFNTKTVTANSQQAVDSATRNGSFTYNTNPNYVHTMTIYYMERGMFESNLKFGFSFHAIPNQFWIDKKIRTKDKNDTGLYDTLNACLFTSNGQSGDASNMTTHTLGEKTSSMTKFEKSFQGEKFTVTQWYGSSTANTLASDKNYTIDYDTTTYTTESDGQYPIYYDKGNAFIGQFTTNNKFKLKETPDPSNKYVYQADFSVWDQANNDKALTVSGDNTNGYTFDFSPTNPPAAGGLENTNIKARFENYMVAHDLVLSKELLNASDTTTDFQFKILFDFDGSGYVSYPLYYTHSDGTRAQLSNTGTVTLKAGESITIDKIPDKAKVKILEILPKTVTGYGYDSMTVKNGSADLSPAPVAVDKVVGADTITNGVTFTTGDNTTYVTVTNKKPDNRYTIKYTYPSYSNLYGNQSYTVTGVFTTTELETYMKLNDSTGALEFKNDTLKKGFINSKAPYEDNFQQTVSFVDAAIDDTTGSYGWVDGNYSAEATATTVDYHLINVYFNLPYEVDSNLVPVEADTTNHRVKMDTNQAVGEKNIKCFDWYVTDGKSNVRDTTTENPAVYVKAPLMLYTDVNDESTIQYFQYWSVKNQSSYGVKAAEYTRCYDYEFNFALFMNCYIEPVYDTTWAQKTATNPNPNPPSTYNHYERFDPELQILNNPDRGLSVTFLENSRNQWNNDDGGTKTGLAADTIYSDFLLSFNNVYDMTKLNTQSGSKKVGLVLEAVEYLDGNNSTGFDGKKDYNTDESCLASEATSRTAIINWLSGGTKPSGVNKSEINITSLDNKNCIQYFTSIKNRNVDASGNLLNDSQNRYKVFRAYAYIGEIYGANLTNVQLSAPAYFTIYDMAKLRNLADKANIN